MCGNFVQRHRLCGSSGTTTQISDVVSKGYPMQSMFQADYKPQWILLVAGDDARLRSQQMDALRAHVSELKERALIVLEISRTEVSGFDQVCRCMVSPDDVIRNYRLPSDHFTASLIDGNDFVKWVAPMPVSFVDIVSVIEELPRREAENATRGPALSK